MKTCLEALLENESKLIDKIDLHSVGKAADKILLCSTVKFDKTHTETSYTHYQVVVFFRIFQCRFQLGSIDTIDLQLQSSPLKVGTEKSGITMDIFWIVPNISKFI